MNRNFRTLVLFFIGMVLGYYLPIMQHKIIAKQQPSCISKREETENLQQRHDRHQQQQRGQSSVKKPGKQLIFAGVMTAEKFLDTRAKTVYHTWGQELPGKLMFFASSTSKRQDLPVVSLQGVDDSYPPQRKSMMMFKYMHDNFIDEYEWFLRSDDDVYVRTDKLERFLRTLNSSDDLYIGQAGTGTKVEKGLLGLGYGDNFCMGGPGVLISASALRKVTQYWEYCLQNLVTTHEDVEVGRCIKNFVGISCTWAFEMQSLFYHNQSKDLAYTGNLHTKSVQNAITLHPLKKPEYMFRLHSHFKELKLKDSIFQATTLQRKLKVIDSLNEKGFDSISNDKLSLLNDNKDFHQNLVKSDAIVWEMFTPRKMYSFTKNSPEIGMIDPVKDGMNKVLGQTMSIINKEARKVLHRTLEFSRLNHGYRRYHPVYGMQYMLDLLMKYHRHIGRNRRRMTVHVRHHAYLQQPFGDVMFTSEIKFQDKTVNFLLPVAGRIGPFINYLKTYEEVCLRGKSGRSSLLVLYFKDVSPADEHLKHFNTLKKKYPQADLRWINMDGRFSRSLALTMGASQHDKDSLLFFCDVDIVFNKDFLTRCRSNAVPGKMVYFPIVFSQFAPEVAFYNESQPGTSFYFSGDAGNWRKYGFGISCQHRLDFDLIGGFDTTIQGWGMEDVDLYDRYVLSDRHTIFRASDPGLVHIYHGVSCDATLNQNQLVMCLNSKSQTYGSAKKLKQILTDKGYLTEDS